MGGEGYPNPYYIFIGFLDCTNCKETVGVVGNRESIDDYDHETNEYFTDSYVYNYFIFPSPPIIRIPKSCTTNIKKMIQKSFELFWIDNDSCSNKIRSVLEELMNELKIRKTKIVTKKGKNRRFKLSLHDRILLYKEVNNSIAIRLLAIKWIGNAGSHNDDITKDQLLTGYELLEIVLFDIFDDERRELEKKIRKINKQKKPI